MIVVMGMGMGMSCDDEGPGEDVWLAEFGEEVCGILHSTTFGIHLQEQVLEVAIPEMPTSTHVGMDAASLQEGSGIPAVSQQSRIEAGIDFYCGSRFIKQQAKGLFPWLLAPFSLPRTFAAAAADEPIVHHGGFGSSV